ncbi:hypothetical protein C1T17_03110 [Sphingobium sp. SCG-1]|uniref:hypothetical protein n=1 Tax=Sphingobium sp. SCG-1 TaxID=2072936 RepID=UPI000CD6C391|nr:hypothetical protein [Sphingobium sp. SCG-1]AUW57226.1 hypothetical protein C1T17_03110 [Sphingobium sp. SCG-1]
MALFDPNCQAPDTLFHLPASADFSYTRIMSKEDERKKRLAQALRENLRRRKGQAREQSAPPASPSQRNEEL